VLAASDGVVIWQQVIGNRGFGKSHERIAVFDFAVYNLVSFLK
jgi:hypothetical protein